MKKRKIKGKRIYIEERSYEEMCALRDGTEIEELRQAYGEMILGMQKEPKKSYWSCDWGIYLLDGTLIGGIGFKGAPDKDGNVELGYGIDEPFRRQGYATEALELMARWAQMQWGVKTVWAETEPDNVASQGLLRKCGFVPDGEGEEGPRFRYEGEKETNWIPIFMCIGMSCGSAIGSALGNFSLGLCLGLSIGILWGVVLTNLGKKKEKRK